MPVSDKIVADLDVATATLVSGAVSVLPDIVGSTDATQGTAANRPTTSTANGNPTLVFDGSNDTLTWPASTASNTTSPVAGVAFWFRPENTTYTELYNCAPDSSSNGRLYLTLSEEDPGAVAVWVGGGGTSYRIGSTATGAWTVDTWTFLYFDYAGGEGTEAGKCRIWLGTDTDNVAPVSLTFTGDGSMPASLQQPADDFEIGNENTIGAPYDGQIGAHIWCLDERLTEAEVQELMSIDPPVTVTGSSVTGSGSPSATKATASGTGTVVVSGSGSPSATKATASGSGVVLGVITGSGSPSATKATSSGSGTVLVSGSGSPSATKATASGTGTVEEPEPDVAGTVETDTLLRHTVTTDTLLGHTVSTASVQLQSVVAETSLRHTVATATALLQSVRTSHE